MKKTIKTLLTILLVVVLAVGTCACTNSKDISEQDTPDASQKEYVGKISVIDVTTKKSVRTMWKYMDEHDDSCYLLIQKELYDEKSPIYTCTADIIDEELVDNDFYVTVDGIKKQLKGGFKMLFNTSKNSYMKDDVSNPITENLLEQYNDCYGHDIYQNLKEYNVKTKYKEMNVEKIAVHIPKCPEDKGKWFNVFVTGTITIDTNSKTTETDFPLLNDGEKTYKFKIAFVYDGIPFYENISLEEAE
ncbi:MAG TPA: hypothetical protein VJY37_03085, partial [Anaerovoracaceae bacterium]|nr:hypothetical protein [Anaerovoracaceae bacterium]